MAKQTKQLKGQCATPFLEQMKKKHWFYQTQVSLVRSMDPSDSTFYLTDVTLADEAITGGATWWCNNHIYIYKQCK